MIKAEMQAQFDCLKKIAEAGGAAEGAHRSAAATASHSFEVTVYGDVLTNDGLAPIDFTTAQKFMANVPKYISNANDGTGRPIKYTLTPLTLLSSCHILEIKANIILKQLDDTYLGRFVELFEDLGDSQQMLHSYSNRIWEHSSSVPP
jgi:hypothetical protein